MNLKDVFEKRLQTLQQTEENAIQKQHLKGKLTARERLNILFDEGTFFEIDTFMDSAETSLSKTKSVLGDGVVTGRGLIQGRSAFAYAQDFSVFGGSLGYIHGLKIDRIQKMALDLGAPIIALIDSAGARIQEGVQSLAAYANIFYNNVQSSGIIPQISVIMGPAAGGAVYSPAMTDFVFMVNQSSYMFLTGPDVIKEVLDEDVDMETLGGASALSTKSGIAQFVYDDDEHALLGVRKLMTYFPSNNKEPLPVSDHVQHKESKQEYLNCIIPDDPNRPYEVKEVISIILDTDSFYEVNGKFAENIVVGFGRLNGKPIGVVANQPKVLAGTLDINASIKGARFVRFCDAFNIPLLILEDVPGFLPGVDQEHNGIIKHGSKLLYAFCEATVPRVTVSLRKSYGGAYVVMNCKNIGGDFAFAWPTAEIAVMGAKGAIKIIHRKELKKAENPAELEKELTEKYTKEIANPFVAEKFGLIDEVIKPSDTRRILITAFDILSNKQVAPLSRKHGNIPL